tara:strand:- start:502 stop:777 length:276 start_codon:yes stop_codon:yes gene_type:complete
MQCQNLDFLKIILFVYFNSSLNQNSYSKYIFCYLAHEDLKANQQTISKYLGCNISKVRAYKKKITSLLKADDKVLLNDLEQIKKLLNNGKR